MNHPDFESDNVFFTNSDAVFVTGLEENFSKVLKIILSDGRIFYTRRQYIHTPLSIGDRFSNLLLDTLYRASRIYLAECKAISLLNYAENSRSMLAVKLTKKGFAPTEFEPALDYLEAENFLSDRRFAESWVRSRLKRRVEGPLVVRGKLMEKGISRQLADEVVSAYFAELDETALCAVALEKQLRKCDDSEKIFRRLQRSGFSYHCIQAAWKNLQEVSI